MNMNNSQDANTSASVFEHTASVGGEFSDCLAQNEDKSIPEQTPEDSGDTLQLTAFFSKTNSSEISSSETEQMPKNLQKKIKRKKSQNSRQIKKWLKGKTDKAEHGESSTYASERENCDDEHPVLCHIHPMSHGESVLNSSILDEILSEKKRILLESAEMSEFLRNRIKT
ncbi:hypothetical protein L798_02845 [Zootermopsis nevadensis]|uniref:Uncharacterized protein n=2 Tax=Zootermopsis nevadensis TaxID=136037 RepID=A0A067RDK2_ZOONE|nr:hypothetical protein L798_02845 [Zootermopsis nevadensis]